MYSITYNKPTCKLVIHMEDRVGHIEKELETIKEQQHNIEKDISKISSCIAKMSTNQEWLVKFFWLIAGISVSTFVTVLLAIAMG